MVQLDRIEWHKVLLLINHNYYTICEISGFFLKLKLRKFHKFLPVNLSVHMVVHTVQLLIGMMCTVLLVLYNQDS